MNQHIMRCGALEKRTLNTFLNEAMQCAEITHSKDLVRRKTQTKNVLCIGEVTKAKSQI